MKALIIGDIFLDEYLFGDCTRISPEAPVPILSIDHTKTKLSLGGAGNTAANFASLGGQVLLVGRVGKDADHIEAKYIARNAGVHLLGYPMGHNAKKTRLVGQRQQLLRIDREVVESLDLPGWEHITDCFTHNVDEADVVIVSDYAKGVLSEDLVITIIETCHAKGVPLIVDTKPEHISWYHGADFITPNLKEAQGMYPGTKSIDALGEALTESFQTNVLMTLGPDGMAYFGQNGERIRVPTVAREVFDVGGAGDTAVAAFAYAITAKMPIKEAIEFANKAAGVVVGKQGTSTVTLEEIEALTSSLHGSGSKGT